MYKYSRYLFTAIPYRTKQNRTKFQSDKILVISKDFGHSCPTNNFVCFKISIRFQFYGIQPVFFQGKNSKNVSQIVTNIFSITMSNSASITNLSSSFVYKSCYSLNFCTDLLRLLRIECPQESKKTFFEIQILGQIISLKKIQSDIILVTSQKFSPTLFCPVRYSFTIFNLSSYANDFAKLVTSLNTLFRPSF